MLSRMLLLALIFGLAVAAVWVGRSSSLRAVFETLFFARLKPTRMGQPSRDRGARVPEERGVRP